MPSINDRGRAEAVRGAVKSQYRDASIIGGISKRTALSPSSL
jgi:hypothetical protein